MTTQPNNTDAELERQVHRLILENRNSLNDPTTNEPYDVLGVTKMTSPNPHLQDQYGVDELVRDIMQVPYSKHKAKAAINAYTTNKIRDARQDLIYDVLNVAAWYALDCRTSIIKQLRKEIWEALNHRKDD